MGFRDILRKGSGLDLVTNSEDNQDERPSGVGIKQKSQAKNSKINKSDEKVLRQLESEVSRAIEKLEDIRDKLRVRRGY